MTSPGVEGVTTLEEALGPDGWRARFRVEPESGLFEGHFEGEPILPGVAHLVLVRHALRVMGGPSVVLARVPTARFRRPVRPGDVIDVMVTIPDAAGRASFEVHAAGQLAANGVAETRRG